MVGGSLISLLVSVNGSDWAGGTHYYSLELFCFLPFFNIYIR